MSTVQAPGLGHDVSSPQQETWQPAVQRVPEGKRVWVRAGAYIIDNVVLFAITTGVSAVVSLALVIALAVAWSDLAPTTAAFGR